MKPELEHLDSIPLVYFVQVANAGPIQIGASHNTAKRIASLQRAAPYDLVLLGVIPCDSPRTLARRLQRKFRTLKLRNNWFVPDDVLVQYIEESAKDPEEIRRPEPDEDDVDPRLAKFFRLPEYREPRPLLTLEELARDLRVSKATLSRYVHAGVLPCLRIGRQIRFHPQALYAHLPDITPHAADIKAKYGTDPFARSRDG
jgi:excisionase family DNA binding protein